ncbi:MAG TPA: DUF3307 domain-containing protein [Solirubrobacterales bacterium]
MPWPEIFAVFVISHLAGDFLLQTNWQATHKFGGLGSNPRSRRALVSHIATYTLAFVPALVWLATDIGAWAIGIGALIALPHLVQDDGRLLEAYMRRFKQVGEDAPPGLRLAVDQTGHLLALFAVALLAGA